MFIIAPHPKAVEAERAGQNPYDVAAATAAGRSLRAVMVGAFCLGASLAEMNSPQRPVATVVTAAGAAAIFTFEACREWTDCQQLLAQAKQSKDEVS